MYIALGQGGAQESAMRPRWRGMIGSVTVTGSMASPAATATGTATATASPTATALADTGGPPITPLSITVAATLALVVTGVVALALLRRRGTS